MKKIQKNAARFDNLKQDFLDDKKYSGTAEATLNGYRYAIRYLLFQAARSHASKPSFGTRMLPPTRRTRNSVVLLHRL